MITVETAPHEYTANYLYAADGLRPFFAADRAVKDGGGSVNGRFEIDGERWTTMLYYQDSGIVHPGEVTPGGTPFQLDEMREFRLKVQRHEREDSAGQQSFNAHLAPRWQGMMAESDDGDRSEINVPEAITEAVNVKISGSNIEFDRYEELLQRGFESVGIGRSYFERPHEFSNIVDAERYVRLDKRRSGPVHARDGPIASMSRLLENDRDGFRKLVENDRDEHGRNLPGYYHTVTLDAQRVREAFPSQKLPKEVKHYYAREAVTKADDHPLAHPKLGASYQVSKWDGKLGVDEIDTLNDELTQTVLSVLKDAGLQINPGGDQGPFFPGAYFDAAPVERDRDPTVSLDLTQIRHEQESVVFKHVINDGGLSPVEQESLQYLVSDGGRSSPTDIADEHDRHPDSVRRALRRMNDLVEREYDRVSLRSHHVAELVADAVQQAESAVENAVEMGARALDAAERGVEEGTSALVAWAARHDLDLNETSEGEVEIHLGEIQGETKRDVKDKIRQRIREGMDVWVNAGQDKTTFKAGEWSARGVWERFPDSNNLNEEVRKNMSGLNGTHTIG